MSLTDQSLIDAATALNDDLTSNGCQAVSDSNVSDFQSAYNASASGSLSVDGYYGATTASALQAVMSANPNDTLGSYTAPAGCVGKKPSTPGGGGNAPVVVSTGGAGSGALPYIVGAIVVAGALAAYTYSHKKGHRRR